MSDGRSIGPYISANAESITCCRKCKEYFILNSDNLEGSYCPPLSDYEIEEMRMFIEMIGKSRREFREELIKKEEEEIKEKESNEFIEETMEDMLL